MGLFKRNHIVMQPKYWGAILLLAIIAFVGIASSVGKNHDFDFAKREILLRRIGHELLLQAGDSTSRVLPIKKINEHEYEISFEQAFTFQPELLVHTTRQLLSKDPIATNYIVNVLHCSDQAVAYGYAIFGNKKEDIITCLGRKQPKACYRIHIKFQQPTTIPNTVGFWLAVLVPIAVISYGVAKFAHRSAIAKKLVTTTEVISSSILQQVDGNTSALTVGSLSFDVSAGKLLMGESITDLTKTEARILAMLATTPNVVVARSKLQKEIWEDEGVIVGRSLDMFISKLRKKLEIDPSISITVVRGSGYKLEIVS
ncbi:MAG TPA: transcriptional regulator [Chitinophagaceae bacterium]|nr:transcriptional regulator [Chitinophagaceae bacterium]